MSRGRSSSGSRGSSFSSSRGSSRSSSRGFSRSGSRSSGYRNHSSRHTTVFVGGGGYYDDGSRVTGKAGGGLLIFMSIFFLLFGGLALIFGVDMISDSLKYDSVLGTCISNRDRDGWYYTTYSYTVDGYNYVNESIEGWELEETIGKTVTIYYLKDNPNVITENKPEGAGTGIVVLVFSLVFLGAGVLLIVTGVKQIKKEKNKKVAEVNVGTEKVEEKIRCLYCGSKYDSKLSSCPKCGASKSE